MDWCVSFFCFAFSTDFLRCWKTLDSNPKSCERVVERLLPCVGEGASHTTIYKRAVLLEPREIVSLALGPELVRRNCWESSTVPWHVVYTAELERPSSVLSVGTLRIYLIPQLYNEHAFHFNYH